MEGWAKKTKIVVVCGPTSTGKTDLAFALCRQFGGELIGADSMQIYEGLSIGTAAPPAACYPEIPRHLVACLPPSQTFSVASYVQKAGEAIKKVTANEKIPLLCGGTGLYIDSVVNGINFTEENIDSTLLEELEATLLAQGSAPLLARLAKLDSETAARLHPADGKRIVRTLAASLTSGTTLAQRNAASRQRQSPYDALVLGLCYDDRNTLYRCIENRIDAMLAAGLLEEAGVVYRHRDSYRTAVQAIGYKEFFPLFQGEKSLLECTKDLKQATRRYAKRQLTWFRHRPYLRWLWLDKEDVPQKAQAAIEAFWAG